VKPGALIVLLTLAGLTACSQDSGPPVTVSNIRILAPLTQGGATVAYFVIDNKSDNSIVVNQIRSPQFSRAEMHESKIDDGISTMRRLESVTIAQGSMAAFEAGGKHIMLSDATAGVSPGTTISLEIHFDESLLIVSAAMQSRSSAN